jgi:hypothetical protein
VTQQRLEEDEKIACDIRYNQHASIKGERKEERPESECPSDLTHSHSVCFESKERNLLTQSSSGIKNSRQLNNNSNGLGKLLGGSLTDEDDPDATSYSDTLTEAILIERSRLRELEETRTVKLLDVPSSRFRIKSGMIGVSTASSNDSSKKTRKLDSGRPPKLVVQHL